MQNKAKYQLIINDLIEKIENGTYPESSQLPTEEQLRTNYDCSRVTIRHALSDLQYNGYITSRQGAGSFVTSKRRLQSPGRVTSVMQHMEDNDISTRNKVLKMEIIPADGMISRFLSIKQGDNVYYVERLRYADNKPIIYEQKYIPVDLYPGLSYLALQGSIYQNAEKNGLLVDRTECSVIPCFPEKEVADLLQVDPKRPVLKVYVHAILKDDTPFFYGVEYYDPDNYLLNFVNKR